MTSVLKSKFIGIACALNNWNSSARGIDMIVLKIKQLSIKKYCILKNGRTIEKNDVERYGSFLSDLEFRKVSASSL